MLPDGTVYCQGGNADWQRHASKMDYPKEPPPWAPKWELDKYQRFLTSKYRPWVNNDPPIEVPLCIGDWDLEAYDQRKQWLEQAKRDAWKRYTEAKKAARTPPPLSQPEPSDEVPF